MLSLKHLKRRVRTVCSSEAFLASSKGIGKDAWIRQGWGGEDVFELSNPKKRAASHEFEVALDYMLRNAEALVPLLKETYKNKWSSFIRDILKGANPYEEATGLTCIFSTEFL